MRRLTLIGLLWMAALRSFAQQEFGEWMHSRSAKGRIEVMATDAAVVQQLALWSERSLRQLETDWRTVIPFQRGQSFKIIVDARARQVRLNQTWNQGVLDQRLVLPEDAVRTRPRELAEAFTRAMAYRAGLAAMPASEMDRGWQVPGWLVRGSAHALLAGRSRQLFSNLVRDYSAGSPPYPERVVAAAGDTPEEEAAAALLCRWLFAQRLPDIWTRIASADFRGPDVWTQWLPTVGNLRELHQQWDLDWLQARRQLMADYVLEDAVLEELDAARIFIPALYGLFVEDHDRYRSLDFSGLEPYLDDPRFGRAMREWILRLQRLRFRQSEEINLRVESWQEAGRIAIRAAEARGRKRERLWREAVELAE